MCKRNTADPLVRVFLDTYGLNLLAIPRADANVGDLYVVTGGGVSVPGSLTQILKPKFTLPRVTTGEVLADIAGRTSGKIESKSSIGLLEGFFTAIGAAGIAGKVKAAYEKKNVRTLRFSLSQPTRDSVDPLAFGAMLTGHTLDEKHPFIQPGSRYLVTTAVVRTPSLVVAAENESANAVDLDVEFLKSVQGTANVSATKTGSGEVKYEGKVPIAIGVELHELKYDSERRKFAVQIVAEAVRVRNVGGAKRDSSPRFIGDERTGDAFLQLQ
jgi:hypothetical protein